MVHEQIRQHVPDVLPYSDFLVLDQKLALSVQPAVPVPSGYAAYWPIRPDARHVIDITLGVLLSDPDDFEILGYVALPRWLGGATTRSASDPTSTRTELFGRSDLAFLQQPALNGGTPWTTQPNIVPFQARRYEAMPIAQIKVINSRNRDKEQFDMNVESIDHVGLIKPVRVNDKFLERTGMYELICGEGRLLAHQRLGHETIQAEVVTCTRKEAYLQSLVENIARTKPDSMDFAREIKRLSRRRLDLRATGPHHLQIGALHPRLHPAGGTGRRTPDPRRRTGSLSDQVRHAGGQHGRQPAAERADGRLRARGW